MFEFCHFADFITFDIFLVCTSQFCHFADFVAFDIAFKFVAFDVAFKLIYVQLLLKHSQSAIFLTS